MQNPKISFVVTARNDDYGGNLIGRTRTFARVLMHLSEKYGIQSEIIFVEYNPIPDKSYLFDVLGMRSTKNVTLKGIVVPTAFHDRIKKNKIPLLEYIAKNIGVRRAAGEYVAISNPDIVFSDEFIKRIAQGKLDPNKFYRADRSDISVSDFPDDMPVEKVLEICKKHVRKILFNERTAYVSYAEWFNRFIHGRTMRDLSFFPLFNRFYPVNRQAVHENGPGDFILAHRSVWDKAHGFDETPHNLYHDSMILFVFQALGFSQEILTEPMYHINHIMGRAGRPGIEFAKFREIVVNMQKTKVPYIVSGPDWGFKNERFIEKRL